GIAQVGQTAACGSTPKDYLSVAESAEVDLTVVGPEVPLVDGVVDVFQAAGLKVVGPRKEAAQLEGSKIYSKELMQRLGIPTARFARVESEAEALKALAGFDLP